MNHTCIPVQVKNLNYKFKVCAICGKIMDKPRRKKKKRIKK